ncbi:MAG: DUF3397 domain-containing protein [Bacillus sp. (in: firmicutes)]
MVSIISGIVAAFVTMPLVAYLVTFVGVKQWTKDHRKAVRTAVDVAFLFCIFSVHFLIISIWETSLLWFILVIMIVTAMVIIVLNQRIKGEIIFGKVFQGFWRLNGIIFMLAYIVLITIGIFKNILDTF